ncbi:MAG: hypothetical protein ACOCXU_06230, partial [Coleofasciculus sp.]
MYRSLCQFTTLMLGESSVSQRPIKNYGVGLIAPPLPPQLDNGLCNLLTKLVIGHWSLGIFS